MGWCGYKEVGLKARQAARSCSQCITSRGSDCAVATTTIACGNIFSNCLLFFSFPGLQLVWVQN